MRGAARNGYCFSGSCRRLTVWLAAALISVMMAAGKVAACHVISVDSFEAWDEKTSSYSTEAIVSQCKFSVRVEWLSAGDSEEDDKAKDNFIVEIWKPGSPLGPEENDYYDENSPGLLGTRIASETFVWNIDEEEPQEDGDKVVEFDIEAPGLSAGAHTLRAWVRRVTTNPENAWKYSSPATITVVEVTDVEWETHPDDVDEGANDHGPNIAIDGHPAFPNNGGWRIFPGKKCYNDTAAEADMRRKVIVKVTIAPAIADVKVYLSRWDVDDPYTNASPIDDNGSAGNDNRLDDTGVNKAGDLAATWAMTSAGGEAKVAFKVSMQPGNNFKIAASASQDKLNEMTQDMADGKDPLPGCVEMSDMLTVWRKLHMELDSMEEVASTGSEKNLVTGVIDAGSCSFDLGTSTTTIDLGLDLEDQWEEDKADHFENGRFWYCHAPGPYVPLETISDWWNHDKIVVSGECVVSSRHFYQLEDEDDDTLLPALPDTGKCNSIFDNCYIACVDDARGSNQDVPFKLNLGGATTESSEITAAAQRGSEPDEANDWWVVYVMSGYQPGYTYDNDPDGGEGARPGGTEGEDFEVSVIFRETLRDGAVEEGWPVATLEQQTVVHEIGHQVLEEGGSAHTTSPITIMNAGLPVPFWAERFGEPHIDTIRDKTSSPGE
jgi:hypothetical protein